MKDNLPAEALPLWDFIEEELWERDWSFRHLCDLMAAGDQEKMYSVKLTLELHRLAEDDPGLLLGQETADALGLAFGVDPQYFLNIHESWQKYLKGKREAEEQGIAFVVSIFLSGLKNVCKNSGRESASGK